MKRTFFVKYNMMTSTLQGVEGEEERLYSPFSQSLLKGK